MGEMDYYRILELTEEADAEAVKRAYRRLAKGCHPDAHPGDKKAEERFKLITEAYTRIMGNIPKCITPLLVMSRWRYCGTGS